MGESAWITASEQVSYARLLGPRCCSIPQSPAHRAIGIVQPPRVGLEVVAGPIRVKLYGGFKEQGCVLPPHLAPKNRGSGAKSLEEWELARHEISPGKLGFPACTRIDAVQECRGSTAIPLWFGGCTGRGPFSASSAEIAGGRGGGGLFSCRCDIT